ncbi:AsmA family protein [Vibrio gallicus]|uniref:AsmA family protein n=1 Tax=Vibrio gallicus TaxID=190897 RepID=UPI0021C4064B|nr:AsmA family protein [Vibrio gallicus]
MKAVLKISLGIILLVTLCISALLSALTTQYSSWVTQNLISRFAPTNLFIQDVKFTFPNQFELKQIVINQQSNPAITFDTTTLVLELDWNKIPNPITIKQLYLSGANIPSGFNNRTSIKHWFEQWTPQHIRIEHLNFANTDFVIRDFDLTYSPKLETKSGYFEHGNWSISGEQLYWQGEALNQLKSRIQVSPQSILVNQLDFQWREGKVQLIAENTPQGWIINDALVSQLRISSTQLPDHVHQWLHTWGNKIQAIEHLKVYQSSWTQPDWQFNNTNIELSNWHPQQNLWAQHAQLSLVADSITTQQSQALEPQLKLTFNPQHIAINQLDFLFEQGNFELSGDLYPDQLHLNDLTISNLKWVQDGNQLRSQLMQLMQGFKDISIAQFKVSHSQVISLENNPWQVSGLNAQGSNLSIRDSGEWALWQGDLSASASSLTVLGKTSLKPYINTESDHGNWKIKELFIPIKEGLFEATGSIDLTRISKPWSLNIKAYAMPIDSLAPALHLAIGWYGVADFNIALSGLAGDELMLRRTLDGKAQISVHDVRIQLPFDTTKLHPLLIPEIDLDIRRGYLQIPQIEFISQELQGTFGGSIDMANSASSQIELSLSNECMKLNKLLPQGRSQLTYSCKASTNK